MFQHRPPDTGGSIPTRQSRETKQEAFRLQCRMSVISLTVTGLRLTDSGNRLGATLYFLAADVAAAMAGVQ